MPFGSVAGLWLKRYRRRSIKIINGDAIEAELRRRLILKLRVR